MQERDIGPWYKQFWAWFIFTPLIVVVIVCSVFVTIAFKHKQDVVSDDYYKVGKMINQSFAPQEQAKKLGVDARLSVDGTNSVLSVMAVANEPIAEDSLVLAFSHPADADKDFFVSLKPQGNGQWSANKVLESGSRWYVRLSSLNDAGLELWRLQADLDLSQKHSAEFE
ncbi:FixH family protein [Agaribacterium sp. ZY112]|uniref:FixH family protein n=1 Tax=Agaribacterium sp. ZY112 TaxID=3233574 RepID=UPI0035245409